MSTNISILLKAVDQASDTIKGVANTTSNSLGKMETANKKVELSSKQVALAVNNVATSGFAMYNAIDRVIDMEVQVDRANLQVKTSLNAVEDAQTRYNKTVEKYGPLSAEAQASQKDLQLAQERYGVATERANMIQGNLNEVMVQSALTIIPSVITGVTSLAGVVNALNITTQAGTVLKFSDIAAMVAHKIATFASAAADAVLSAATWVLNAGLATQVGLLTLGVGLVTAAVGVTLFMAQATGEAAKVEQKFGDSIEGTMETTKDYTVALAEYNALMKERAENVIRVTKVEEILKNLTDEEKQGLEDLTRTQALFFSAAIESSKRYQENLRKAALAVKAAFEDQSQGAAHSIYVADAIISAFAKNYEMYGFTVEEASRAIAREIENVTNKMQELPSSIPNIQASVAPPTQSLEASASALSTSILDNKLIRSLESEMGMERAGVSFAEGGIVTRRTMATIGEAGPEAVIPLDKSGFGATIEINSPLVYVAGSADERTVDLAVKKVEKILDNIILEASSSGSSSTHKRVRIGTGRF